MCKEFFNHILQWRTNCLIWPKRSTHKHQEFIQTQVERLKMEREQGVRYTEPHVLVSLIQCTTFYWKLQNWWKLVTLTRFWKCFVTPPVVWRFPRKILSRFSLFTTDQLTGPQCCCMFLWACQWRASIQNNALELLGGDYAVVVCVSPSGDLTWLCHLVGGDCAVVFGFVSSCRWGVGALLGRS